MRSCAWSTALVLAFALACGDDGSSGSPESGDTSAGPGSGTTPGSTSPTASGSASASGSATSADTGDTDSAGTDGGCVPGQATGCDGSVLMVCSPDGVPVVAGDCTEQGLDCIDAAPLIGCYECSPVEFTGTCEGSEAINCVSGFLTQQTCPDTCQDGICCVEDQDGDGFDNCGGDCDDSDPDVFPGQEQYFASPSEGGTFDYNCNGELEIKHDTAGTCACCWLSGGVPGCGQEGEFRTCDCGAIACPDTTATQSCR